MSENQEVEFNQGQRPEIASSSEAKREERVVEVADLPMSKLNSLEESIDSQSYFLGEVPQVNLVDPNAFLPLNSDSLAGSVDMIEKLGFEASLLIEEEVAMIQKHQKKIAYWEERIEKNKEATKRNEQKIKQNNVDALYDKKNRDYWLGRAEEVEIDYSHAEVSGRVQDWQWLIKKYGLKNADGSSVDAATVCVEELCNGETKNLSAAYRSSGEKYETARKLKEGENSRLFRENGKLLTTNETLQGYISSAYTNSIEPLQDGVLLLKELSSKLKAFGESGKVTFGELRAWAEPFLSDFIKDNPRVSQDIVTQFRKLTSIPLPPEYS